jgi:hypothetical protein
VIIVGYPLLIVLKQYGQNQNTCQVLAMLGPDTTSHDGSASLGETPASGTSFTPSASIPASDIQAAIENVQQTANSIASAQFVVAAASSALSNERVTTDSNTITWDHSVTGQAKAHIPNDSVTFAKVQNITTDRLLGRDTSGSGNARRSVLIPPWSSQVRVRSAGRP